MDITTKIEQKRNSLTERLLQAAKNGDKDTVLDRLAELEEMSYQAGMDNLLGDLHDLKVINDEAIETAIVNNGATDPRH